MRAIGRDRRRAGRAAMSGDSLAQPCFRIRDTSVSAHWPVVTRRYKALRTHT